MKNKTEVSRTDVCVRVVKAALEGGGEKIAPSPHSPPLSPSTCSSTPPPQTKIKCESPTVYLSSHTPPRPHLSPPPLGPGAEVKGKPGNPIASGSSRVALPRPNSAGGEEGKVAVAAAAGGGRLTFFKEGKFLLELSHRTDMGAPAGWVPVKSKTYWPPPSSATTTTTQHPLRHDTPTSQSVSDDCSSLNSSPWTSDHARKQSLPHRTKGPAPHHLSFFWCCSAQTRTIRRKVPRRRNPHLCLAVGPLGVPTSPEGAPRVLRGRVRPEGEGNRARKARLEKWIHLLGLKLGVKLEAETSVQMLFERPAVGVGAPSGGEGVDPTFISPRKRYLRQMETDQDAFHRKKVHHIGHPSLPGERVGGTTSSSTSISTSSPCSTSSPQVGPPRPPAISSLTSSVYSIESILNSEGGGGGGNSSGRRNDSFLRTLLKPEARPSPARPRERGGEHPSNPAKTEQLGSTHQERVDALLDTNRLSTERYDLSRYGPVAGLYGLGPFLDPRLVMLHQALAPGLVPPTTPQPAEMAQALAAAAAGLGTYPLGPLHPSLSGAQYPPLLPGGLPGGYTPPTSIAAQLLRPPTAPSRSSPHHVAASPSPKPHYPSSTPSSPHPSRGASPRGRASPWQPTPPLAHPLSPHPSLASPLPSPPPQDAPLNLSKPRNHFGK